MTLMHTPYARVNTLREGLFRWVARKKNGFLSRCPLADIFSETLCAFRIKAVSQVVSSEVLVAVLDRS